MSDLIDRQLVIGLVGREFFTAYTPDERKAEVRALPSVQPERKKGKWLTQAQYCDEHSLVPSGLGAYFWCSCCEEAVEKKSNYCPNCGANMQNEAKE